MYKDFADWYQSTNISVDQKILELRWAGVEQITEKLDLDYIHALSKIAFGRNDDQDAENEFKNVFKGHDTAFLMHDNQHEVAVLASSVLAFEMADEHDYAGLVATTILTAHLCGTRKLEAKFDLIGIANNAIINNAHAKRARPAYKEIEFPNINKTNISKKINELPEQEDFNKVKEILDDMSDKIIEMIKRTRTPIQAYVEPLWDYIQIQDEELEMAWWLINQWCQLAEKPFDKLQANNRAVILGKETADLTHLNIEPPSLTGILTTAGVNKTKQTIPEAVNACGVDILNKFENRDNACSTVTPVLHAIVRAIETNCSDDWVPAWENITGISKEKKIAALDIAKQVHREHIVLKHLLNTN